MFVAFCLWSTEGFIAEVVTCSTVSIMRIIILMKTSLYFHRFPQVLKKVAKNLAFPLYHSSLILGACLYLFNGQIQTTEEKLNAFLTATAVVLVICAVVIAVYDFRMHLTLCLEAVNATVLALSISLSPNGNYDFEAALVLLTLAAGTVIVLSLQRHLFLKKSFGCVHITFSSLLLAAFILFKIVAYVMYSIAKNSFVKGWISLFLVVLIICAWLVVIYLLRCHRGHGHGCCSQWRKIGYLCCTLIAALLFTTNGMMSFYYAYIILQIKELAGFLALIPLLSVLPPICLFKHPKHLPEVFHIMVYMFGAVGLSAVNAIVLATELILKAGKGARTIEDLRVIVLPLETVFVFAWLTLQIYDAWMKYKDGALYLYEDTRRTGPEVEMKALQENIPNPD
ncbi:uncharacterized protein LOC124394364 [Silurus meridionalis]|uniref:uncharacterized protein LOC124394364 n=1 Tax=Silurus meridionalis TaxID=175797 RepID=UPI001EEA61AF|nr:uncharacterized protein LOC124394364 [Silurus meridionalis]XP_046718474.1 uncharacterized protein LOC124394364 [Silurus meridionalis]